jgi:hypothetical protein
MNLPQIAAGPAIRSTVTVSSGHECRQSRHEIKRNYGHGTTNIFGLLLSQMFDVARIICTRTNINVSLASSCQCDAAALHLLELVRYL